MIRVDRSVVDDTELPTYKRKWRGKTSCEREKLKAEEFFSNPNNYRNEEKVTSSDFTFSVYKNKDLVAALEKVFGKKCAYCESDFSATSPREVEHFRPKKSIETGDAELKPGYYWLAADWDNLLISCIDCNRRRGHEVAGETEPRNLGKLSLFPLADEAHRVRKHDEDIEREEDVRQLLNPCIDEPEKHLLFEADGNVCPREVNGQLSSMGMQSIEVYALRRADLVFAREKVLTDFRIAFVSLHEGIHDRQDLDPATTPQGVLDRNLKRIRRDMDSLKQKLAPNAEYLAAKRQFLREARDAGGLDFFLAVGIDLIALSDAEVSGL